MADVRTYLLHTKMIATSIQNTTTMKATTSTAEQRISQFQWRPWGAMLSHIECKYMKAEEASSHHVAIDMGCGTGEISNLIAERFPQWNILGLDQDEEMLKSCRINHSNHPRCSFLATSISNGDLSLQSLGMTQPAGLIWSSFTVQYFMKDLPRILDNWSTLLQPNGLLILIETNGLFSNHRPMSQTTMDAWIDMEDALRQEYGYECAAGHKLAKIIQDSPSWELLEESGWADPEFAFDGPAAASPQILDAWRQRLGRMKMPQEYFGTEKLERLQQDFLTCLAHHDHSSPSKLTMIIARKKSNR